MKTSVNDSAKEFVIKIGNVYPNILTVVDKSLEDHPLIYVNKYFEDFTGYTSDEVVGKNCRFLQYNPHEDQKHIKIKRGLADYIQRSVDCCIDIKNYKKDGTPFVNRLCLIHFGESLCIGLQNIIAQPQFRDCLLYTSPSPRDRQKSRMPSSA